MYRIRFHCHVSVPGLVSLIFISCACFHFPVYRIRFHGHVSVPMLVSFIFISCAFFIFRCTESLFCIPFFVAVSVLCGQKTGADKTYFPQKRAFCGKWVGAKKAVCGKNGGSKHPLRKFIGPHKHHNCTFPFKRSRIGPDQRQRPIAPGIPHLECHTRVKRVLVTR